MNMGVHFLLLTTLATIGLSTPRTGIASTSGMRMGRATHYGGNDGMSIHKGKRLDAGRSTHPRQSPTRKGGR